MLFLSPGNSIDGHVNLIDETDCKVFLHSHGVDISDIVKQRPMKTYVVPSLDDFLEPAEVPDYPFHADFETARRDPLVALHTSGSTGLPKPIIWPHDLMCTPDAYHDVGPLDGRQDAWSGILAKNGKRLLVSLPLFHCAGIVVAMTTSLYFGTTVVFPPSDRPLSATVIDEILDYGNLTAIWSSPWVLEEVTKTPTTLEKLSKISLYIASTGTFCYAQSDPTVLTHA